MTRCGEGVAPAAATAHIASVGCAVSVSVCGRVLVQWWRVTSDVCAVCSAGQVIAVARTADLVIIMLDATKSEVQRELLEKELEAVGIRLNKPKPGIYFKQKKAGGIHFNSTCALSRVDEKLVQLILHEYKIFNAEVRPSCSFDAAFDRYKIE